MTDERNRESEHDRPAEEPAEEHGHLTAHDIVEEIREEIAEHVPQPVRWTVGKLFRVIGLAFTGLVLLFIISAVLFAANRTDWVAGEVTLFLNQTLALRSDVALEIKDLKGNPFGTVRILEPRLRFRDREGEPILEADAMTVTWSPWEFVRGRRGFDIQMDRPIVRILTGENGMVRLPRWSSGKASTAVSTYDVRLRVRNGTVVLPDTAQQVKGLAFDTSLHTGRPTRVQLHALAWDDAPYVGRLQRARGRLEAADSIRFRLEELVTPGLKANAFGGWEAGDPNTIKERVMHVEIKQLDWSWLAKVTRNRAFEAEGSGSAHAEVRRGADGAFSGTFTSSLDWNGLQGTGRGGFRVAGPRIELAPLDVVSAGGRLAGRFEMDGKPWTLSGEVEGGDPEAWSALGLIGWPAGDLDGRFRYAVVDGGAATITADLAPSELAGWRADSGRVVLRIHPAHADSFDVRIFRRGGTATLLARADEGAWRGDWTARAFPLDEWPDGRATGLMGQIANGGGAVEGREGGLFVTGDLSGTAVDWLGATGDRWRVEGIDGRLLPTPDLVAHATIEEGTFLGLRFDSVRAGVQLGDEMIDMHDLEAIAADTVVTLDGRASWNASGWSFEADGARARSNQFDWLADGPVLMRGDAAGVTFERVLAHDGPARLEVEGTWASTQGEYAFEMRGDDLALGRLGFPLEWGLEGWADATLKVDGPGDAPRWRMSARARGPGARGSRLDSLEFALEGRMHEVALSHGIAHARGGAIEGLLAVRDIASAWPDTLTPDGVARWLAGGEAWEGELRSRAFPLGGWGEAFPDAAELDGRLAGSVAIGGRPRRPVLTARLEAAPVAWGSYRLDQATGAMRYEDGVLRLEDLRARRAEVTSTASGTLPVQLAVGQRPSLRDAAMQIRLEVPGGDLDVLPLFVPQIGAASGPFTMRATLEGTPDAPRLEGTLDIRRGRLRLATREEELREVTASMHFDAARITLDTLVALQGRQGRVTGSGVVDLDGLALRGYRFDLQMRDVTAIETGLYSATFDGRMRITDGTQVHGQTLPHVVGEMELLQASILLDFANESEMQQFTGNTQPLFWTYRVRMHAPSKLRWEPPNANVEFSADLVLEQTPDSLAIFGDVTALRGQYYFLSNRFDVQRALLNFDNVGGVDPSLDIEAITRVPDQGRTELVTVLISGRARSPVIEFEAENPDWDQPTVLRELTVGRFVGGSGSDRLNALGDPLDDFMTRAINRQLSSEMSRAFQGYVNEWAVQRESGGLFAGEGDLYAQVGIPVSDRWQIRYRQRVPGLAQGTPLREEASPFERDLEVEYRLNRFFFVTSELMQRRALSGTATRSSTGPEFNVNLKARWEY